MSEEILVLASIVFHMASEEVPPIGKKELVVPLLPYIERKRIVLWSMVIRALKGAVYLQNLNKDPLREIQCHFLPN